ncbi:MAG: TonB-dependent receptor [marine benthic group bacterium]|nr:TonB-dependent receptor [Gemmatimonadota bacterium]
MRRVAGAPDAASPRSGSASGRRPSPLLAVVLALTLLTALPPAEAAAQETDPPAAADTLRADTLRADSLLVPADSVADQQALPGAPVDSLALEADSLIGPLEQPLEGTLRDSAEALPFARLPDLIDLPVEGASVVVADLAREDLLRSNGLTLLELLEEQPALTPLRASFFGGPHQASWGGLGPGFLTVLIDGREVPTMDGAQPDLTRFPIAALQRVRIVRGLAGWRVELFTMSRQKRDAYSRVEGGTGDPGLSRLRLVFDNGFGRTVRVAASADLVDAAGEFPSSDFDFFGLLEWTPGDERSGIALTYESESMDREVYTPVNLRRTEVFLRGRYPFGDRIQLQMFGGSTGWKLEDEAVPDSALADRSVLSGGATLRGDWDRIGAGVTLAAWDSDVHPHLQLDADVGGRVIGPIRAELGGRLASWEDFDVSELRGGVSVDLPLHLTLRAGAATGTRGVSYPTFGQADSLGFTIFNGRLELTLPSLTLYGLAERQDLDRQLPYRSSFDRYQEPIEGPAGVTALEAGGSFPILPLSWLIEEASPLRLGGFFRYQSFDESARLMYVPQYLARGTLGFDDEFLDGNLGVRLALGIKHRGSMGVPTAGAVTEPSSTLTGVPEYTFLDWNMAIRILSVIVYYRYDNITGFSANDFVGLSYPGTRSVFGVKWTFLN